MTFSERRDHLPAYLFAVCLMLLIGGCGRISFDPVTDATLTGDSALDSGSRMDAPSGDGALPDGRLLDSRVSDGSAADSRVPDGSLPDGGGGIGVAGVVAELSAPGASDKDPVLRHDLLEIYLSSDRPGGSGGSDLWRATRARSTDPWGLPTPVTELNTGESETSPTLSGDALTMMFARTTTRGANLFTATRSSFGSPWGSVTAEAGINSGAVDGCPALSADALTIAFCSQRRGGTQDLHTAIRATPTDPFGTVNFMGTVSTASTELSPYLFGVSPQNLLLASDRPGGMGANDIYETVFSDAGSWATPTAMPTVNGPANDEDPWSTNDGRLLYFASDRAGDYDIFIISLP